MERRAGDSLAPQIEWNSATNPQPQGSRYRRVWNWNASNVSAVEFESAGVFKRWSKEHRLISVPELFIAERSGPAEQGEGRDVFRSAFGGGRPRSPDRFIRVRRRPGEVRALDFLASPSLDRRDAYPTLAVRTFVD